MIDLRLRAYAPNGAALGLLPEASELGAGLPFDDVSSLTVTYSRLAAGGTVLDRDLEDGLELALEYTTGGAWVEPRNGRFLYLKREFDVVDETDTVKATCPGYAWQLRKARLEHKAGVEPVDGKRPFLSATVGAILVSLLTESQARGEVTGFTTTATSTHDSAGAPWSQVITIYYEPGLDLWSVLDSLTQQGMCDWAMQGRELQLYNVDTALGVDRTTGADPTSLRLGRDVTNAPSDESIEELISRAVLRGDNGLVLVEDNPTAPTPWGVWTGTISQGGVSDEGTMRALVQADLARGARVRGQYTRELITTGPTPPLTAYGPGDFVMAAGATRELERLRVRQVTLSKGTNGVTGSVVLNDRVLEAELRRSRRISGIVGGASADGGSGARPTTPGPDRRTPEAPTGLVVDSDAYIDATGMPRAAATATWAPVTHATDGTVLEGVSYVLWGRPDETGEQWRSLLTVDTVLVSTSPFDVGSQWQFRVQAVSPSAVASAFSGEVTVTMEDDTTPPPPPSAPILTTKLGTVTVTWDGLTETGTAMPHDFERVEVRRGVPGTPGPVIGTLRRSTGADFLVATGLPPDDPVTFEFQAIDRSGNASAWSELATIAPVRIAGPDLEANSVTANEIEAGSITTVALSSDAIDGMTITGALIRTAATGDRIELSGSSLKSIQGTTERVVMTAAGITVNASGGVNVMSGGSIFVQPGGGVWAYGADSTAVLSDATVWLKRDADTGWAKVQTRTWAGVSELAVTPADRGSTFIGDARRVLISAHDAARTRAGVTLTDAGAVTLDSTSAGGVGQGSLTVDANGVTIGGYSTTSTAANVVVSTSAGMIGRLFRSTSSLRYKQDVALLDVDDLDTAAVLGALAPRTWRDRLEVEADPDAQSWHVGTIAEVLDEAGLGAWVTYDEQGRADAVSYDRLVTLLAVVVARQQDQIDALTHPEPLEGP